MCSAAAYSFNKEPERTDTEYTCMIVSTKMIILILKHLIITVFIHLKQHTEPQHIITADM